MPTVIGSFISRRVYDSKLRTVHSIRTTACCRFVDVRNGEEVKKGVSWMVRVPGAHQSVVRADAYLPRMREK